MRFSFTLNSDYKTPASPMVKYSIIIFLLSISDAIVSYVVPVFINSRVQNTLIMGIILSISSISGLICDLLFSYLFRKKTYSLFLTLSVFFALIFSLNFLILPPVIYYLIFSMFIWGIYYEFLVFSNFNFIHRFVPSREHAPSWGFLESFRSAAYFIGPVIATYFLNISLRVPFYFSLFVTVLALFSFVLFLNRNFRYSTSEDNLATAVTKNPFHEFKVWGILLKKVWPLYIFLLALFLVDSTFWSVGTLLSEDLKTKNSLGGLLLAAYMLPSLSMILIAGKASKPFGKKRIALLSGILGGLLLLLAGTLNSVIFFIILVTISSLFLAIARVEMFATFEDYVARLGIFGNDVIGLRGSSANFGYIIGPILSGWAATLIGNKLTFSFIGLLLLIVSLVALVATPKKIRMPFSQIFAAED